jgi:hypothetical protein
MFAPIADIAGADANVIAALGPPPNQRFYSFGLAPEQNEKPYAVWQVIGGSPENLLSGRPDSDRHVIQVDAYAKTANQARSVARVLAEAFELDGYITSWNGEFFDTDTQLRRISFTVEFITPR